MCSRGGAYRQAILRLMNTCITGCDEFVSNQLRLSKQKFDYSFFYMHLLGLEDQFSATEDLDAVVHLDTFGSPKHESVNFQK